ncbi:hypothetical protein B6U74_01870 [Candidatus Bathyarchaeota archaeon ex4484_205]|nr:MAG: hypothetical protein B6U74_01870 [Candidatus Bathyarchaeota archaeon ex4484_205]
MMDVLTTRQKVSEMRRKIYGRSYGIRALSGGCSNIIPAVIEILSEEIDNSPKKPGKYPELVRLKVKANTNCEVEISLKAIVGEEKYVDYDRGVKVLRMSSGQVEEVVLGFDLEEKTMEDNCWNMLIDIQVTYNHPQYGKFTTGCYYKTFTIPSGEGQVPPGDEEEEEEEPEEEPEDILGKLEYYFKKYKTYIIIGVGVLILLLLLRGRRRERLVVR